MRVRESEGKCDSSAIRVGEEEWKKSEEALRSIAVSRRGYKTI